MRKGLAVVAVVLGSSAVLAGLAVAVTTGPDDTVSGSPHRLPAGGAQATTAYSAWPQLLSYRDLTVVVTARGRGSVFVGTANPIDAASYADGVGAYRFNEVSARGRITGGTALDGAREGPAVAPATADLWTSEASGRDVATLEVSLDGTPVSVVAVSETGPIRLGFGVRLPGLFWTAAAVVLVGLLLVGYGGWTLRRRRLDRGETPSASRVAGPTASGVALLIAASGCGWVPEEVEPRPPTKVPLTRAELPGMLESYDRRYAAAVSASLRRLDARPWSRVTDGSVFAVSEFFTQYQRETEERRRPFTVTSTGRRVFAPTARSYPLSVLTTSDVVYSDATAEERREAREHVTVAYWRRECATCEWVMVVSGRTPRDREPVPRPPGAESVATTAQTAAAARVLRALTLYMRTGRAQGITPAGGLKALREDLASPDSFERTTLEAIPWDDGGIHVVRVQGGALALLEHSFTSTSVPKNGSIRWSDQAFGRALNQSGDLGSLTESGVVTSTVFLPDGDEPEILDVSWAVTGP